MPQTSPSLDARATKREHYGHSFLRLRKSQLAFGAFTFTAMLASLPGLAASAEVVPTAQMAVVESKSLVASQTLETPTAGAAMPDVSRADYFVTVFAMVQAPAPAGTGILSAFGGRAPACSGCSSFHSGADFALGAGTPVLAIADGVVSEAGSQGSLGTYIKIEHVIDGATVTSGYAHLGSGSMPFSVGDVIARGTQVGVVGMTGAATAPHLHFEIRLGGPFATPINPIPWLAAHVNA